MLYQGHSNKDHLNVQMDEMIGGMAAGRGLPHLIE